MMPYAALAIVAASLGSLVVATLLQQVFGFQPCILCLFQRVPYAAALILSVLALLFRNKPSAVKGLLLLCTATFLVNVGIAGFHSGVERGWWTGTNSCAVEPLDLETTPMTTAQLLTTAIGQCDEIDFSILGVSLANINVFFSLGLAILALFAAFGWIKEKEDEGCCCCKKL